MEICPFLSKYRMVKEEIKADDGTVIEERENPVFEEVECKRENCPLYDSEREKCSLVNIMEVKKFPELIEKVNQGLEAKTDELKTGIDEGVKNVIEKADTFYEGINTHMDNFSKFIEKYGEYKKTLEDTIFHSSEDISHKITTVSENIEVKFSTIFEDIKGIFKENFQKIIDNLIPINEKLMVLDEIKGEIGEGYKKIEETLAQNVSKISDVMKNTLDTQNNIYEELRALTSLNQSIKENLEKYVSEEKEEVNALKSLNQDVKENLGKFVSEEKEVKTVIESYLNEVKDERSQMKKMRDAEETERANDRAVYYYYTGNKELSLKELEKAEKLSPDKLEVIVNKGMVLSAMGRKDEAMKAFEKVLEIEPTAPEALSGIGLIYFNSGEIDQSIEFFRKALESDKDYAMGYANLGYALKEKGDIDEAIKMWGKAVSIDPLLEEVQGALKIYKQRRIDE